MNWIDDIDEQRKQRKLSVVLRYGRISPEADKRDLLQQAREEALDFLNYIEGLGSRASLMPGYGR